MVFWYSSEQKSRTPRSDACKNDHILTAFLTDFVCGFRDAGGTAERIFVGVAGEFHLNHVGSGKPNLQRSAIRTRPHQHRRERSSECAIDENEILVLVW